jgi:hypothetical protein
MYEEERPRLARGIFLRRLGSRTGLSRLTAKAARLYDPVESSLYSEERCLEGEVSGICVASGQVGAILVPGRNLSRPELVNRAVHTCLGVINGLLN